MTRTRSKAPFVLIAAAVVVAIMGLAGLILSQTTPRASGNTSAVYPQTTAASVSDAESTSPGSSEPDGTESQPMVYRTEDTGDEYPLIRVAKGKLCESDLGGPYGNVGTANETTSCPFAKNVRQAYIESGIDGGEGTVHAHSPVTKLDYTMSCSGTQPVLCTGGVAAEVLIFGGRLVIGDNE